jgi:diamine N-acetyltransferase
MKIRKLKESDAVRMNEWMKNPDVNEYFQFDGSNSSVESCVEYINKCLTDQSNLHYAVTNNDDLYMGTVSLKSVNIINRNAEYAISMHHEAIGKGYSKFATDEILKIAFFELSLERVYLNVVSENIRAIKFYEKYGFIYEGEFKKHLNIRDKFFDVKWFRILKNEHEKLSENTKL